MVFEAIEALDATRSIGFIVPRRTDSGAKPSYFNLSEFGRCIMTVYREFEISAFEIGGSQWHARFRRIDGKAMFLDGVSMERVELGFAWPAPEAALADARKCIDRMIARNKLSDAPVADALNQRPPRLLYSRALETKAG